MVIRKAKPGEGGMSAVGADEPIYWEYQKPPESTGTRFKGPTSGITKMAERPPEDSPFSASSVARLSRTAVPTGQVSTQATTFAGPPPVYPKGEPYVAQKWDEGEIASRARMIAAPGILTNRRAVQMAMTMPYRNPNERRMRLRDALEQFGVNVARATATSRSAARQEYSQQYQIEEAERVRNWQAVQTQRLNEFNASLNSYLAGRTTTITTEKQYPETIQNILG